MYVIHNKINIVVFIEQFVIFVILCIDSEPFFHLLCRIQLLFSGYNWRWTLLALLVNFMVKQMIEYLVLIVYQLVS